MLAKVLIALFMMPVQAAELSGSVTPAGIWVESIMPGASSEHELLVRFSHPYWTTVEGNMSGWLSLSNDTLVLNCPDSTGAGVYEATVHFHASGGSTHRTEIVIPLRIRATVPHEPGFWGWLIELLGLE